MMSSREDSKKGHKFEGKMKDYEQKIIDFFKEMAVLKEESEKSAIIKGYLLVHDSLTQKQLKKLTRFSIGSISTYLNALMSIGLCEKRLILGTHAFKYSFAGELDQILEKSTILIQEQYNEMEEFLKRKLKELNNDDNPSKKGHDILKARMNELIKFFQIVQEVSKSLSD